MCEPISIATAVIGAVGSVVQMQQQNEQAKAQVEAMEQSNIRARDAQALQQRANAEKASQENYKVAQQIQAKQREAMRERASIRASSAEGGIGGVSAGRSLLSISLAENEAIDQLNVQAGFTGTNLSLEQQGAKMTADNRMQTHSVGSGFGIGDALGVASAGLQGYKMGNQISGMMNSGSSYGSPIASSDTSELMSDRNLDFYRSEF